MRSSLSLGVVNQFGFVRSASAWAVFKSAGLGLEGGGRILAAPFLRLIVGIRHYTYSVIMKPL